MTTTGQWWLASSGAYRTVAAGVGRRACPGTDAVRTMWVDGKDEARQNMFVRRTGWTSLAEAEDADAGPRAVALDEAVERLVAHDDPAQRA